jgi:hypothetical protein
MSDEFYKNIRKECEDWEKTPRGFKFIQENSGILNKRKLNDFMERIIEIDIELLDDYYLLFKCNRVNSLIVIQTLKKEGLNFIYKEDGLDMNFVLFFDTILDSKDKSRILGLFSKNMKVYLELLNESIISSDFDKECTGVVDIKNKQDLEPYWTNYFYFADYYNSDEYKKEDIYNFLSLPTNHIEIIQEDEMRNTYRLTKSNKRIRLTIWN